MTDQNVDAEFLDAIDRIEEFRVDVLVRHVGAVCPDRRAAAGEQQARVRTRDYRSRKDSRRRAAKPAAFTGPAMARASASAPVFGEALRS